MNNDEILKNLADLPGWEHEDNQIQKTFKLKGFKSAIEFVNKVAEEAERIQHHPDLDIRYNKVTFTLSTHSENGLTQKDFNLAQEIEKLAP